MLKSRILSNSSLALLLLLLPALALSYSPLTAGERETALGTNITALTVNPLGFDPEHWVYLPIIIKPEALPLDYANVLVNGSFEEGWETVEGGNQRPNGWLLSWVPNGELLYDEDEGGAVAQAVPEIVHKLSHQLPPDEQLGGPNALILEGEATYKIFQGNQPYGAELRQTVSNLIPGSVATLTVPIQIHWNELNPDPWSAESGVWVNGEGVWVNMEAMGNRAWYTHTVEFIVPADGLAEVLIRVKSKWAQGKDFFIDDVQLQALVPQTD